MIYTVTQIRCKERLDTRAIGYYFDIEDARKLIRQHAESLCEAGYYQYMVIEGFGQGWYPTAELEEWYEFKAGGKQLLMIEKPERYSNVLNFGLG